MNRILLSFLISLSTSGAVLAQSLGSLNWLVGDWHSTQPEYSMLENWTVLNDSTLSGKSRIILNGETQFSEDLTIEFRSNTITYIAVLPSKTAIFPLDRYEANSISFVDTKNDFPSHIEYQKTALGMDVILIGKVGKEEKREIYQFIKK